MGNDVSGKKPATPTTLPRRTKTINTALEPIEEVQEAPSPKNKDVGVLRRAASTHCFYEPPKGKPKKITRLRVAGNSNPPVTIISKKAGEIVRAIKSKPLHEKEPMIYKSSLITYCNKRSGCEGSPANFDHNFCDTKSTSALSGIGRESGSPKREPKLSTNELPLKIYPPKNSPVKSQPTYGQLARPLKCKQVIVTTLPSHYPIKLQNAQLKYNPDFRIRVLAKKKVVPEKDDVTPLTSLVKEPLINWADGNINSNLLPPKLRKSAPMPRPKKGIRMLCEYLNAKDDEG